MITPAKIVERTLQAYWRRSRALTLGAQGMVLDAEGRVLLVRHGYRPGWHFPGGGVERGETVLAALRRELVEEVGIICEAEPELFGVYSNARSFPGDHILLYVTRAWRQPTIPPPNAEIVEQKFFPVAALPETIHRATRERIEEVLHGAPRAELW